MPSTSYLNSYLNLGLNPLLRDRFLRASINLDQEPVKTAMQWVNAGQTDWPELRTFLWNFGTTVRVDVFQLDVTITDLVEYVKLIVNIM